jgi:hypothetical protein
MKNKTLIIILIFSHTLAAALTGYIVYDYMDKDIVQPVVTPVVSKPVERPKDITFEQATGFLWHYDHDPVKIDWKTLDQKGDTLHVGIKGNLFQRDFSQEAWLPITVESQNWKIGLGFTFGAAAVVGGIWGMHKLGWLKF